MSVRRDVPNSHGGHVDPEVALVDLEATVASIDNSRLLVATKTADINSELLKDLLRTQNLKTPKDFDQISRASSLDSMERQPRESQQTQHHSQHRKVSVFNGFLVLQRSSLLLQSNCRVNHNTVKLNLSHFLFVYAIFFF